MKKISSILMLISVIFLSCTTTNVKIKTVPKEGYDAYYNDMYIGRTPCGVEASNLIFKSHHLVLKTNTNNVVFDGKLTDEFKWLNGCVFVWAYGIPLLWAYGPKENQVIGINDRNNMMLVSAKPGGGKTGSTIQYRLAVMDFQAKGVSSDVAKNVSELVRTDLISSGRFVIIERSQMNQILKEQGIQQSGCTEISCAVQVGQILSANKILIGSIMKIGKNYVISGRIVDVEKGIGEKAASESTESIDDIVNASRAFSYKISESE